MSNRRCAMRSRRVEALLLAAVLLLATAAGAAEPRRGAVDEAAAELRDIPTLVGTRTEHELTFHLGEKPPPPKPDDVPEWIRWLDAHSSSVRVAPTFRSNTGPVSCGPAPGTYVLET